MPTDNDVCIGYIGRRRPHEGEEGVQGVCCCGLYWQNRMPLHDSKGKPLDPVIVERHSRERADHERDVAERKARRREQDEQALAQRLKTAQELAALGAAKPIAPGYRLTKVTK